jgi:formylmethanofuran dehydrogenase subunit E
MQPDSHRKPANKAVFEELLSGSVAAHGHLCPGQVVGVRMAILGLRLLDFNAPPPLPELKRLIVFVEMDRCTGDAVAFVSNAKLGRRSLKYVDYGIMAATFINLEKNRAFRVISTEEARDLAPFYAASGLDKRGQQLEAYRVMPDSVLFRVQEVVVDLTPYDLPGPTRRPCAGGAYFQAAKEITWDDMNWSPQPQIKRMEPRSGKQQLQERPGMLS